MENVHADVMRPHKLPELGLCFFTYSDVVSGLYLTCRGEIGEKRWGLKFRTNANHTWLSWDAFQEVRPTERSSLHRA